MSESYSGERERGRGREGKVTPFDDAESSFR